MSWRRADVQGGLSGCRSGGDRCNATRNVAAELAGHGSWRGKFGFSKPCRCGVAREAQPTRCDGKKTRGLMSEIARTGVCDTGTVSDEARLLLRACAAQLPRLAAARRPRRERESSAELTGASSMGGNSPAQLEGHPRGTHGTTARRKALRLTATGRETGAQLTYLDRASKATCACSACWILKPRNNRRDEGRGVQQQQLAWRSRCNVMMRTNTN